MPDAELDDFRQLSRTITDDDRVRLDPPADLWAKISAAVEHDGTHLSVVPETDDIEPAENVVDMSRARTELAPRTRRMRRRYLALTVAAAAVALVVGFSLSTDDGDRTLVAQATNADLPEPYGGSATATVTGDEGQTLRLEFTDALPDDEPIEIWLIKPDLSDMRSLGLIDDQSDSYAIPVGLDLSEYSLVDLSVEPNDGDPTHSGRSILRGELQEL